MKQHELEQLAKAVAHNFTPFAWTCECGGEHKDCAKVMDTDVDVANYWQLQRIVRFIEEYKG